MKDEMIEAFDPRYERKLISRLTAVGAIGNVVLVVFKLFAGLVGRSSAMVSDAVHSLSDVLATLVAYVGATYSKAPADKAHPYGHEQIENLASIVIGLTLLATGAALCYDGVTKTYELYVDGYICESCGSQASSDPSDSRHVPTLLPLFAAIVSILSKECMFWYTLYHARRLKSSAFEADAWHHRSDALSSIGSLIGIVGARMGYPVLDPLASVVISVFILKVAYDILRSSALASVDTSASEELECEIRTLIESIPHVERLDLLRTRQFGSRVYVETEISVDGTKTLFVAHHVAHEVHNAVESSFPCVKHVMVHVNPTQLSDSDGVVTVGRRIDDAHGA